MIAAFFAWPLIKGALDNWRLALGLLAIVALLVFGAYERIKGYEAGKNAAIEKIEKANDKEKARAQAAAKNVDDCAATGGDWDRDYGLCKPAAAGQ